MYPLLDVVTDLTYFMLLKHVAKLEHVATALVKISNKALT